MPGASSNPVGSWVAWNWTVGLLPVCLHPPQLSREAQQQLGLVEEGIRTLGPVYGAMKQTRQM